MQLMRDVDSGRTSIIYAQMMAISAKRVRKELSPTMARIGACDSTIGLQCH